MARGGYTESGVILVICGAYSPDENIPKVTYGHSITEIIIIVMLLI